MAVLNPAGPIALGERSVILATLALCAVIVVPVFFLLFLFAWKYRAGSETSRQSHHPRWDHYSAFSEILWWLPPLVIVFFLSVIMWHSTHALDPYAPLPGEALQVEVVALDWKWLFIYPQEGIATVNMLEIPENVPVHFELTADAPMNSFWIPSLGGQIMVMPGMTTQLSLEASRAGDFNGLSGNISGQGFAGMAFTVHSVSQGDFNMWVRSLQSSSIPLSPDSYRTLAAPSTYNPVVYYYPVDGDLFDGITMQYMSSLGTQALDVTPQSASLSSSTTMNMHDMPMQMDMNAHM